MSGLQQGTSYDFKLQARNEDGISDFSDVITVLAAKIPGDLLVPTIEFSFPYYIFKWQTPVDAGGSPLKGYKVTMFDSSDVRFSLNESDCDTSTTSLETECRIEAERLTSNPFDLVTGNTFIIKVAAINEFGDSPLATSDIMKVVSKPDAPIDL